MDKIILGKEASAELVKILDSKVGEVYTGAKVKGLYETEGARGQLFVAYDNSNGYCWTEEFADYGTAMLWLLGKVDNEGNSDSYEVNTKFFALTVAIWKHQF